MVKYQNSKLFSKWFRRREDKLFWSSLRGGVKEARPRWKLLFYKEKFFRPQWQWDRRRWFSTLLSSQSFQCRFFMLTIWSHILNLVIFVCYLWWKNRSRRKALRPLYGWVQYRSPVASIFGRGRKVRCWRRERKCGTEFLLFSFFVFAWWHFEIRLCLHGYLQNTILHW